MYQAVMWRSEVGLAAWRCCSSDAALGYERLIVALHHGVMALTPEQHSQIARTLGRHLDFKTLDVSCGHV
jgi:hypothetical protein